MSGAGAFEVLVEVALRPGIADPQGATIERALPTLGFTAVSGVRTGKAFRFSVDAGSEAEARVTAEDLCRRFLTNPVIEDALITVSPVLPVSPVPPAGAAGTAGTAGTARAS